MKIATKLNITLTATGFVLFGTYAIFLELNEERGLRKVAEREIPMLGRAIQVTVENAVREDEEEDIRETLSRMEKVAPPVDIIAYDRHGRVIAESPGSVANDKFEKRLARQAALTNDRVLKIKMSGDSWRGAVAYRLNDIDGSLLGTVVVARPLSDMKADLSATKMAMGVDVLLFVILSSSLGWIMGRKYIGEPLKELITAMRQVRVGNLRSSLFVGRHDEVGQVATEFNVMVSELFRARENLEKEHTDRLHIEAALRQADKLVTIGQLAASLAHEIGSPLQVVIGRARAIVERDYDHERIRQQAEFITAQGERIASIVEQLLGYARRRVPEMIPTDLGKLVRSTVELIDIEARKAKVTIAVSVKRNLPTIVCDPSNMQQLMINLLRNALASTHEGGHIEVRVGSDAGDVADVNAASESVFLEVSDTGCGIPEENLSNIFEPFFTTRADEKGTGLGLAVVEQVVHAHNGKIRVKSEVNVGTTFRVDLPLSGVQSEKEVQGL